MNEDSDANILNLTQQVKKLQARKGELKGKVKDLQKFAKKQFQIIEILEKRIKTKCDIKEESFEHLLCKQRRLLKYLNQLEEENADLDMENRSLRRTKCCHRNEC